MRVAAFILAAAMLCAGCGSAIPKEDAKHIQMSLKNSAAAYAHASDAGAEGILIDLDHCELQAVVRDLKLPGFDSGVPCPPE